MHERRERFVELGRQFREYESSARPEELALRSYITRGTQAGFGWAEVLAHRLVVVLGEPGSGKTWEVEDQARRLAASGAFAFFVRLEDLANQDLASILGPEDHNDFRAWLQSDKDVIFFLDSVDEARLHALGDFHAALRRLRQSVNDDALSRLRLVISSRISDWQRDVDRAEVLRLFPSGPRHKKARTRSSILHRTLRFFNRQRVEHESSTTDANARDTPDVFVVTLEPLLREQVGMLARKSGLSDPDAFLSALDDAHAWEFARRPLDVSELAALWQERHRIGPLTEVLAFTIERHLRETPAREEKDRLSPEKARSGAEFLAAATLFCRQLMFRMTGDAPASGADSAALDTGRCLPPVWSSEERSLLLRRPLFDSASYGRVRFHHRRIGEYLAAQWLLRRVQEGCPIEDVEDLLCDIVGGQRILRPALVPVTAWVCGDEGPLGTNARGWVLEAAPEIHLQYGDPASLSLAHKRAMLQRLVAKFVDRQRVWIDSDPESLSRLSDPALAPDVSALLRDTSTAKDIRAELLLLVRFARLSACLDVAVHIILSHSEPPDLKSYAAAVIRDLPDVATRRRLADDLRGLAAIPNRACGILCEALYPEVLDAAGLMDLLRKATGRGDDLAFLVKTHLEEVLQPDQAATLLRYLLNLVQSAPHANPAGSDVPISQAFEWVGELIPYVARRLLEQAVLQAPELDGFADAILFLSAHRRRYLLESPQTNWNEVTGRHAEVRRTLFWRFIREWRRAHTADPAPHFIRLIFGPDAMVFLTPADLDWLIENIQTAATFRDRTLAVRFSLQLADMTARLRAARRRVRQAVAAVPELHDTFRDITRQRRFARPRSFWHIHVRGKLGQRWWWDGHVRRVKLYLRHLYEQQLLFRHFRLLQSGAPAQWLLHLVDEARGPGQGHLTPQSWDALAEKRGRRIARAAREGCKRYWPGFTPELPHEGEPNKIDGRTIIGLAGIDASLRDGELDFATITPDQARQLVHYAVGEINGCPPWLYDLARLQPNPARDVLAECIRGEWLFPADRANAYEVLHDLSWHGNALRPLVAPTILGQLEEADPQNALVLQHALSVLFKEPACVADVLPVSLVRLRATPPGAPAFTTWFAAALQLDALKALAILETKLAELSEPEKDSLLVKLCAALGEGPGSLKEVPQLKEPDYVTPEALARFIPLVYEHVRRDDDIHRAGTGSYHPIDRDAAQHFRDALLTRLGSLEAPRALEILIVLHDAPPLAPVRDWIARLIDERRARTADLAAWRSEDIPAFAQHHETDPQTDADLFRIACKRLRDVKREVEIADISLRDEVRDGDPEPKLRVWLVRKLRERARGRYTVPQEGEIDLEERPDLRLEHPHTAAVPIEVKWADKWSVSELLGFLEAQLVGKYLRAHESRNGIYFVATIRPSRRWPYDGRNLSFTQVLQILQQRADELMRERPTIERLVVVGVDFRRPAPSPRP